jgi:hypothetical protein
MGIVLQFAVWSLCANALAGAVNLEGKLSCAQWKEAHLKKGTTPSELVTLFGAYPGSESVPLKPLGRDARPGDYKERILALVKPKAEGCPLLAYFDLGKSLLSDPKLSRSEKQRAIGTLLDRIASVRGLSPSVIELKINLGLLNQAIEMKLVTPSNRVRTKIQALDKESGLLIADLKKRSPPGSMECFEKDNCDLEAYRQHHENLQYELDSARKLSERLRELVKTIRKDR